ncbi:MAG: pyridoxal-phosphate dependent enzyme [Pseudomonadota bacterium]
MNTTFTSSQIDQLAASLHRYLRPTPSVALAGALAPSVGRIFAKMELWQVTGSFKARGALANIAALSDVQRQQGVTAVSAGNHAIATAFAAEVHGVDAKVVMTASAPAYRVALAESFGAEVCIADDVHAAFEQVDAIVAGEQRHLIHPFEGKITAMATAGVGREFALDVEDLDAVIVPVGGGGLAAGVSAAVRLTQPDCVVYGVEPQGADSMSRSFSAGSPQTLDRVQTIADSLGAPMAMPITYALCRDNIDQIVTVSDAELRESMRLIHRELTLCVEPACAAALAALRGPLQTTLRDKRVGLIFCGSNIDVASWSALVAES